MDDERVATSGFVVTPEVVAGRTFTTGFRGFDQGEVRTFLRRVSEELAGAAEREAQLRRLLQEAQNKAAHPEVDEELLTNALGEHAARLLATAREQAAQIRTEAETRAARLMRDADAQIARIRSEADSLLARRVDEVDGVTANLRNAAEADAKALREQAKADAEAELHSARTQGREMVAEARAARERILADLARRRHVAEVQLDQLRAARERLLGAYALVRRTLDEATQELKMAEVEARLAADEVGRRAPEPPPLPPDVQARREERTPPAGTPAVRAPTAAATAGHAGTAGTAATTTLRPPRAEPAPARTERRPPSRPGDTRPLPPRRPSEMSPVARTGGGAPPSPPSPPSAPSSPASSGPSTSRPSPPSPPSILPRPVPPPPARSTPPASPREPDTGERPWPSTPPADRVDELFARIKADRAAVAASAAAAPPAPPPPPPPPPPPAPAASSPAAPPTAAADTAAATPSPPGDQEPASAAPEEEVASAAEPVSAPPVGTDVADESARARRDELLEPIEDVLVRQLKRVLQDEQNEVLDRLRRKRRRHGSPLLSPDEQMGRFREAAESVLDDALRAGGHFASQGTTSAQGGPSPDFRTSREVAETLAREIAEPLRQRLERALSQDGDGAEGDDVSEAVSAVYRQWRSQELEPLARYHAFVAFSRGAFAAHADDAQLRWIVEDEAPCPDCDDNALAGAVTKGQAYPTGQQHPPAHQGCRCLLVPAVP
jgi:DivIVA domain-containing protein